MKISYIARVENQKPSKLIAPQNSFIFSSKL